MMKWLMSRVFPGVDDVLARPLWLQSMLIRLDLPTLLLPMKAYSGLVSFGHWLTVALLMLNSDFVIFIYFCCKGTKLILIS
jgi:hypothetical protein